MAIGLNHGGYPMWFTGKFYLFSLNLIFIDLIPRSS